MAELKYRLGIDIGGTFTDFTLVDNHEGTSTGIKSPTNPEHIEEGIRAGIKILKSEYGLDPSQVSYFVHGMTIGLNTLLQRRGSKLAFFVTKGFKDMLNLQRLRPPVPFNINSRLPEPLIRRDMVFEIDERTMADGSEYAPVDEEGVRAAVRKAVRNGAEGVAVCFLHSYKNNAHEQAVLGIIRSEAPDLSVSLSSELLAQIREYERACVAIINLYIQKNVKTYFEDMKRMLAEEGFDTVPFITQSNGGIMDIPSATAAPIKTLFSGPAAGVIGAVRASVISGEENLLTFDVGGTSTDVSVVRAGEPTYTEDSELAGFPINLPAIDIASIGAGGGSIGWLDKGLLRLGPESAGSYPGPACYGHSELPTLTDAFLLSGYLNAEGFAAGRMPLDKSRSYDAIKKLGDELGSGAEETAGQMIQVAIANMYVELSGIMERNGYDPRELSVVAYGGGGPVTASLVAEEIHAKNVLVPYRPGTLCSLGALTADFIYDAIAPVHKRAEELTEDKLKEIFASLKDEAIDWLKSQDTDVIDTENIKVTYLADGRYHGQAYEIQFEITDNLNLTDLFHQNHELLYGHSEKQAKVEIINLRAHISALTPKVPNVELKQGTGAKPYSVRDILVKGRKYKADIYRREDIGAGDKIAGPAIIEQADTTILLLPGWTGISDKYGTLILKQDGGDR